MSHVVFDLNGTLTDVRALAAPWGHAAPDRLGPEALDEAATMGMADTLGGVFRPFPELLRAALGRRAQLAGLDAGAPLDLAMRRAAALPAHPEAAAALDHLRAAGFRVAVLTNSASEAGRRTLEAAGLLERVDRVDGADAARAYKPDPRLYALAEAEPGAWFVAAHWWDVTGAARAGLRTAWISRDDRVLPATAPAPDVVAADLLAAARTRRRILTASASSSPRPHPRPRRRDRPWFPPASVTPGLDAEPAGAAGGSPRRAPPPASRPSRRSRGCGTARAPGRWRARS